MHRQFLLSKRTRAATKSPTESPQSPQVTTSESTRGNVSDSEMAEAAEAFDWHRRLAELNAGKPDPITSMDDPGYWAEKHDEITADRRAGIKQ